MSDLTDPAQRREFAQLSILDEGTRVSRDSLRDHVRDQHPGLGEDAVTAIVDDLDHLIGAAVVAISWPDDDGERGMAG